MDKSINKRLSELGVTDKDNNISVKKEPQNNFYLFKKGNPVFANGFNIGYIDKFRVVGVSDITGRDIGCKWETRVIIKDFTMVSNINNTIFISSDVSLGRPGSNGINGKEKYMYFERYFKDAMLALYENTIELYSVTRNERIKNKELVEKDIIRNG